MSGALARVRQANKRLPPENSVAVRIAVTVAVLAAATATLRQDVGGPLLQVAVIAGIPAANVFSHVTRHREGLLLKVFLAFGILVAFAAFLASVTGIRTGDITDVQIPLAELFLWTQLLHSLDVPARRDLQFSLVSSLVLMAIGGVLSITMEFSVHLVVWTLAALTTLVLFHRSELGDLPAVEPRGTTARGRPALGLSFKPVLTSLALVLLLAVAAFFVVPPAGTARALSFPTLLPDRISVPVPGGISNPALGRDDPGAADLPEDEREAAGDRQSFGYFGFADSLDTGIRGRPDDTLVMRVRAVKPDFWRGQSFDVWDGRTWTLSDDRTIAVRGERPLAVPVVGADMHTQGSELVQTFFVERAGPNMIFAAYQPDQLYFPDNAVFQLSDGSLRSGVELDRGAVYTVISRQPRASEETLRSITDPIGGRTPPSIVRRYLQLPETTPRRVRDLARRVTAGLTNPYDKVRAIEAWMGDNTEYTLDIPRLPRGADAVERFLFVDKRGFCEQIGTSLVVMLRSLGIPARLAVGYAAGDRNPFTGLYEVRAHHAHAWAEVWFPGIGWQGFDPTASVPLAGDAAPRSAGAGALRYLTARLPSLPKATMPALIVLGTLMALGAVVVQASQLVGHRRRLAQRPWAVAFVDRLETEGRARGRPRAPGQTNREYVHALASSVLPDRRLDPVADLLDEERFSRQAAADGARRASADAVLADVAAAWPPARAPRHALRGRVRR